MTTVADFGEYTDVNGTIKIDDVTLADVECDFSWERTTIGHKRAGKRSEINFPGGFTYKLTVKKALIRDDIPSTIGYSLTDTPISGTADSVKEATVFGDAGVYTEAAKTMTTPSVIRFTLSVDVVTTAGYVTLIGEDAGGNIIEDTVYFPTTMLVGGTVDTAKPFKKVYGWLNQGVVSTGGGKIALDGVAGTSTWTVGDPKIFDLELDLTKGAHVLKANIPDCWFTTGGISWTAGGELIENSLNVAIHDWDEIEWSNT